MCDQAAVSPPLMPAIGQLHMMRHSHWPTDYQCLLTVKQAGIKYFWVLSEQFMTIDMVFSGKVIK